VGIGPSVVGTIEKGEFLLVAFKTENMDSKLGDLAHAPRGVGNSMFPMNILIRALAICVLICAGRAAPAQSLSGIRIGDDISTAPD
jgi:hypothetical protein